MISQPIPVIHGNSSVDGKQVKSGASKFVLCTAFYF
jgi:hypothetical protein